MRSFLVAQQVKDLALSLRGEESIPGLGISVCCWHSQKQNKKPYAMRKMLFFSFFYSLIEV